MEAISRVFYEKEAGETEKNSKMMRRDMIASLLLVYGSIDSIMLYVLSLAYLLRKEYFEVVL